MENQETELKRFKRKAHGYKAVLEVAPMARVIEAVAIGNVLEGFRQKKNLSRSEMVIVDLMAGTGFVSECLHQMGFKKLHAFEACNEMSQDTNSLHVVTRHFALHPFADVNGLANQLKRLRPHVIVCLAGFHHLIEYQTDGATVDTEASLSLQTRMATACMEALSEDGMLLIVDIYEDDFENAQTQHWPYWHSGKVSRQLLAKSAVPVSVRESLLNAESFQKFRKVAESQLSGGVRKPNPSLHWFHQVVDSLSVVGHKDVALRPKFIERLAQNFLVSVTTTACPWIFPNRAALDNFLLTFWFDETREDEKRVTQILQKAESINGVHVNSSFSSFGWNLGFVAVETRITGVSAVARAAHRRMSLLFLALSVLCVANICFKLFTYWSGFYGFMDIVVSVVLGAILNEVVAEWQRRSEKMETKNHGISSEHAGHGR